MSLSDPDTRVSKQEAQRHHLWLAFLLVALSPDSLWSWGGLWRSRSYQHGDSSPPVRSSSGPARSMASGGEVEEYLSCFRPAFGLSHFSVSRESEASEEEEDPFAPSSSERERQTTAPSQRSKGRQTSELLLNALVEALCNEDDSSVPNTVLAIPDALYLGYGLRSRGEGDDQFEQSVLQAFEAHLDRCCTKAGRDGEPDPGSVGRAHGSQWIAAVRAHLRSASAGRLESFFAKDFVARILAKSSEGKPKSLEDGATLLVACNTACHAYLSGFEAGSGAKLGSDRCDLVHVLSTEVHRGMIGVLRGVRFHVAEKLKEWEGCLALASGRCCPFGPQVSQGGGVGVDAVGVFGRGGTAVHEPFRDLLEFLSRLWESQRSCGKTFTDYPLVSTCLEVLSGALTCVRGLVAGGKVTDRDADFKSSLLLLNALELILAASLDMRREVEASHNPLGRFEMSSVAVTLCNEARDLEAEVVCKVLEGIESFALRFFITPLEKMVEDWESDQLPEEEIQSILIGFAGFTDSILTHASLMGLSAESRDRMTALFAEILCHEARSYVRIAPPKTKKLRDLFVFLAGLANSLSSKLMAPSREVETSYEKGLAVLRGHALSECAVEPDLSGNPFQKASARSDGGEERAWFSALEAAKEFLGRVRENEDSI